MTNKTSLSITDPGLIITPYGPKLPPEATALYCRDPSLTKQAFADECDINNIMARYAETGIIDYVNETQPQYGDVTGADFFTAQQIVAHTKSLFEGMPSALRTRFENDPQQYLEFMESEVPHHLEEAYALGVKTRPVVPGALDLPEGPPAGETVQTSPNPAGGASDAGGKGA